MSKEFASKRKFGNVTYDLFMGGQSKTEAEKDAKAYRKKGMKVRVVPGTMIGGRKVYLIYRAY